MPMREKKNLDLLCPLHGEKCVQRERIMELERAIESLLKSQERLLKVQENGDMWARKHVEPALVRHGTLLGVLLDRMESFERTVSNKLGALADRFGEVEVLVRNGHGEKESKA